MAKKSMYYEPNAHLKGEDTGPKKRKLMIRFRNQEDVNRFTERSGIAITPGKNNKVSFPVGIKLEDFFN
jgi:hypothetical protein